ncbi:kinase-like domain-containing protein [Gigaspora rosea]|uniref:Kinase-like domain-containing protein n=1 Tax=Gigaspora rosea TaxID=44941 RepID=A0A397URA3_9GLOM|nr:kinase-like domain-containing protein [Gigaspora rosea]
MMEKIFLKELIEGLGLHVKRFLETDDIKSWAEFAILHGLRTCPYIIGFHGHSKVYNNPVIVFDWASKGNLKELYTMNSIDWNTKLKIARDICNGLLFIHQCNILHHDIRCENILITENYEPKIANFRLSRTEQEVSVNIENILSIIRWLAPEKLSQSQYDFNIKYDHKCEMYSFGMLSSTNSI